MNRCAGDNITDDLRNGYKLLKVPKSDCAVQSCGNGATEITLQLNNVKWQPLHLHTETQRDRQCLASNECDPRGSV